MVDTVTTGPMGNLAALTGIPNDEMSLLPLGTGGYRLDLRSRLATGQIELHALHPSVSVAICHFLPCAEPLATLCDEETVKLHFQIEGEGHFELPGERDFWSRNMTACAAYQPSGMIKRERYRASEPQASVTIFCAVDYLRELLAESADRLPSPLHSLLRGRPTDDFSLGFPISHGMASAATALLGRPADPGLRNLEVQTRSFELIYQFFRRLQDLERQTSGRPRLNGSDHDRLEDVRRHLEQHYGDQLTLAQLARRAGTNETKLSSGFKERYQCTIIDYLRRVRMERASFLLRESDLTITQIALEVGYEHPANFATAFKRAFGQTPRDFKLRG